VLYLAWPKSVALGFLTSARSWAILFGELRETSIWPSSR
jgi:hypothetical protein